MLGLGIGIPFRRRAVAVFSPSQLFANGEQGAWYDPSDLTTLYQDSTGTTPVTAVEQPVGLMLDKSKGLVLGPELVTNGDFDSTSNWTLNGTGVSISGGTLNFSNSTGWARQSNTDWQGKYVEVSLTVVSISAGAVYLTWDGGGSTAFVTAPGTYTYRVYAQSSNFYVFTNGATTASVDNVSLKVIPGNHAYQSTSASRPVLSARVNLLERTEDFSNAWWGKTAISIVTSTAQDPDGGSTATTFSNTAATSTHRLASTAFTSGLNTMTLWAKAGTASFISINRAATDFQAVFDLSNGTVSSSAGCVATIVAAGNGFYKLTLSTPTVASQFFCVNFATTAANAAAGASFLGAGETMTIWHPDVRVSNETAGIPAYQRVNTSTDYDTVGFPTYLRFDGVDDWLQTNSINFTSTDKMTVWAGLRKLSDAAIGVVAELSADANAKAGSFNILAPHSAANATYQAGLRGNSTISAYSMSTFAAPRSDVLSVRFDTSGSGVANEIFPRANGAIPTLASIGGADSGTGNFGNYPLFIGRRGGTTLPFNGRLTQLIVRGAQTGETQLQLTEKYLNDKTKAFDFRDVTDSSSFRWNSATASPDAS